MIGKKEFFKKYNISETSFEKTGLTWKELENIYDAYEKKISTLKPYLNFFAEQLRISPKVHSIKARLKDPEHVVEKIIRVKQSEPSLDITAENFHAVITDLIGLRALHLFKEEWESIHDWITKSWELKGKPIINIRDGDQPHLVKLFEQKGCEVKRHPLGYRSAHYIVVSKPSMEQILAEIQVRTIFEEGWSEIDHLIRYPYIKDNPILEQYLVMFNRLAGSADEMGSYIKYLDAALKTKEAEFAKAIEEKSKKIKDLQAEIERMKIRPKDKELLNIGLDNILKTNTPNMQFLNISKTQYVPTVFSFPMPQNVGYIPIANVNSSPFLILKQDDLPSLADVEEIGHDNSKANTSDKNNGEEKKEKQ